MQQIHLERCKSTQNYALELLSKDHKNFIVSCDEQTQGRGQGSKTWDALGENISFSFTALPANPITLTSLEMGVLLCQFFQEQYQVYAKLKWPNDLLNDIDQKCGGILINNPAGNMLVVGIGINLSGTNSHLTSNYKIPAGFLLGESIHLPQKELCYNIATFISNNRLASSDIIERWNRLCGHLNKRVIIFDEVSETHGTFKGVGINGQALIDTSQGLEEFYSGSLKLL